MPDYERRRSAELAVRLHGLRGTVEAIAHGPIGPSIAVNQTAPGVVRHETPFLYQSMLFLCLEG